MDASTFESNFQYYKGNLSKSLNENTVNLMLHAYCMAYCDLSSIVGTEFHIDIDPVLEKITELSPLIADNFD